MALRKPSHDEVSPAPRYVPGEPLRVGAAIIGAQKAGTTSLASALSEHRQICLASTKETHLFDDPMVQRNGPTLGDLERHFGHRRPGQILLDATPSYIYLNGSIDALLRHEPEVRLIAVLRSSVDRALSQYYHSRRHGLEHRSLISALALEPIRLRREREPLAADSSHRHHSYIDRGRYDRQLPRLLSMTPNLLVLDFEQLVTTPEKVVHEIFDFLDVDRVPVDSFPHLNRGRDSKSHVGRAFARARTFGSTRRMNRLLAGCDR